MTVLRTRYQKHVISALGAYSYYHIGESIIIDPQNGGMDECSPPSKRNKQEMQTMRHGLSNFLGAIAAWLCLAPVAFAREPLSMPGTLAPASTPTHYIANLSPFLIWITGGIFLAVWGVVAFAPFRFCARKSYPLSGPAQFYASSNIDLAWTAIPVLVLVLFLATAHINSAIQNVSKPGGAVDVTAIGR